MAGAGIETEIDGPISTVRLTGELDIAAADEIERAIEEVERSTTGILVIDLRALEFMDSTGLRLILSADARARERGSNLILVRGPEAVDRVFRTAGLDRRLSLVDDPQQIPNVDAG